MMLNNAKEYLRDVTEKKRAVPYARYTKKLGHRHGLENNFAGRYPTKTAVVVLNLLKSSPSQRGKQRLRH
jgi:large subunit ribosomal protein L22